MECRRRPQLRPANTASATHQRLPCAGLRPQKKTAYILRAAPKLFQTGSASKRPLVIHENLEPCADVSGMIFAHLRRQQEISDQEHETKLGQEFLLQSAGPQQEVGCTSTPYNELLDLTLAVPRDEFKSIGQHSTSCGSRRGRAH